MKKTIPYLLIVAGIVLTVIGIVLLNNSSNQKNTSISEKAVLPTLKNTSVQSSPSTTAKTKEEINKEKGDGFEKYVVEHLNKSDFRLLEWQSDKYHNGIYAENNLNPDFVVGVKGKDKKIALECKWRSRFTGKSVTWSTEEQLERYRHYQKEKQVNVFVVLGVGGEPMQPAEVFIIPLRKMNYPFATKEYLQPFRRDDVNANFTYDEGRDMLK